MKVHIRAPVSYSGLIIIGGGGGGGGGGIFVYSDLGEYIIIWRGLVSEFYSKLCEVCF